MNMKCQKSSIAIGYSSHDLHNTSVTYPIKCFSGFLQIVIHRFHTHNKILNKCVVLILKIQATRKMCYPKPFPLEYIIAYNLPMVHCKYIASFISLVGNVSLHSQTIWETWYRMVGNFHGVQIFVDFVHSAYP